MTFKKTTGKTARLQLYEAGVLNSNIITRVSVYHNRKYSTLMKNFRCSLLLHNNKCPFPDSIAISCGRYFLSTPLLRQRQGNF